MKHFPKLRAYYELCKPRVVLLMILTSLVGMYLASPGAVPFNILFWGNLGIAFVASSAAAINHAADQHYDKGMHRTQQRPLVQGVLTRKNSIIFSSVFCFLGLFILIYFINTLTAVLSFLSLIGYAFIYTFYLKHATPQNIVIGGIAGAAPPLLGWAAVSGTIAPQALLLVLIVFIWTPPHFWALAIYRSEDYAKVGIPMLPLTHSIAYTKLNILLYTFLLCCVTALPFIISMSGLIYLVGASILNLIFIFYTLRLLWSENKIYAIKTFYYSIYYLGLLFILLLIDHHMMFKLR
jgi:protoheme IX farnesyltransferase